MATADIKWILSTELYQPMLDPNDQIRKYHKLFI